MEFFLRSAALHRAIVLLLLTASAGLCPSMPARALSIQEYLNSFSDNVQYGSLRFAMTTEAYRNIRDGNIAKANCINRNFVPATDTRAFGFATLKENMRASKAKGVENVESYILSIVDTICGNANGDKRTEVVETFTPSPVWGLFQVLENDEDRINVLRLALSTQALRNANAGQPDYAQCIMSNLVRIPSQDKESLPAGFVELTKQLAKSRSSRTANVESNIIGAIVFYCGEAKP
jgi:hypothetical protein